MFLDSYPRKAALFDYQLFRHAGLRNLGNELITLARNGGNELPRAKNLSQCRYLDRKIVFLDELLRPNAVQQLLFGDQSAVIFDEVLKEVLDFRATGSPSRFRTRLAQSNSKFSNLNLPSAGDSIAVRKN